MLDSLGYMTVLLSLRYMTMLDSLGYMAVLHLPDNKPPATPCCVIPMAKDI